MNAMDFYLRSVDAQTWQDCEAEGVDPDAALTELPSPVPEPPATIVEVAPPAIIKPPPAPAVRPPQPPQSPQRRVPQSPGKAASARRHSRVPQSPTEADESAPLYEAVTFQPKHERPTKQPVVRSRPPLRQRAYDAPHAGRAARTLTAKTKGQELVRAWPCRTPIIWMRRTRDGRPQMQCTRRRLGLISSGATASTRRSWGGIYLRSIISELCSLVRH